MVFAEKLRKKKKNIYGVKVLKDTKHYRPLPKRNGFGKLSYGTSKKK